MKDDNFPWFSTVKTVKCYDGQSLKDNGVALQTFFTKFKAMETFKGIITEYFNPLEFFERDGIHVKNLYWSLPEKAELRDKVIKFLEYNQCHFLRLYGGFCDKAEVDTIH